MQLTNKRALITGGTKGIGAAIAMDLARQGCDVLVNGRHADESAEDTRRAIESIGRKCIVVAADVARAEEVDRLVLEAERGLGGLDIVIHSAGGASLGTIDQCSPEQWKTAFDVHVHAAYFLCRRALPVIRKAGEGAVILISSVAGIRGVPGHLAYATVKGAILQFTRSLARDEADNNIRVNCVAPGIIRTRFHDSMTPEAKAHNLAVRIPLHREGTTDQVAEAVRALVTNDFITGEVLVVDGGSSMQICR
ncbi:MAG TPA: SDR family NAD(P)-dependent oxidoreductase [Lacipirellulaceae bacterium]|jgi:NAD(P)-dependent dehydrogenase (short-subunit alcohol dehydrogenase family)|nr:SDR family NAD(P)-dependent oxidoreductase [Lacipirellulaceae bacterium]